MTLGIGYETFRKGRRLELEADGLPATDPILNLWNKADVIAWVENRRRNPPAPRKGSGMTPTATPEPPDPSATSAPRAGIPTGAKGPDHG